MAKYFLYDKSILNSIFVSGILDNSAENIAYSEDDKLKIVVVKNILKEFANKKVELLILTENDSDENVPNTPPIISEDDNIDILCTLEEVENIIYGTLNASDDIIKGKI